MSTFTNYPDHRCCLLDGEANEDGKVSNWLTDRRRMFKSAWTERVRYPEKFDASEPQYKGRVCWKSFGRYLGHMLGEVPDHVRDAIYDAAHREVRKRKQHEIENERLAPQRR